MPSKYECPRCGRKFTQWGAEKLGFKCPKDQHCPPDAQDDIELVPAGTAGDDRHTVKSLRKRSHQQRLAAVRKNEAIDDDSNLHETEEMDSSEEVDEYDIPSYVSTGDDEDELTDAKPVVTDELDESVDEDDLEPSVDVDYDGITDTVGEEGQLLVDDFSDNEGSDFTETV